MLARVIFKKLSKMFMSIISINKKEVFKKLNNKLIHTNLLSKYF